jgi:hypothetical protein
MEITKGTKTLEAIKQQKHQEALTKVKEVYV